MLGWNFSIDSISVIEEWTTSLSKSPHLEGAGGKPVTGKVLARMERFQGGRPERGYIPTICPPDETPMGPEHIKKL
jgi:hypothetical protein